jgi:small subunit ribosomal protein S4
MLKIKSKYKVAKRLGAGIFEQTQTQKFALSEARSRKQRTRRPRTLSDYGKQLIEKQKVRYTYGLSEKQFVRYVKQAMQADDPATTLHRILEMRLDNTAYRMGLAPTRRAARQLVSHGHLLVNGRRMTIPSHHVRTGDTITIREGSRENGLFAEREADGQTPAPWVTFDSSLFAGSVISEPSYEATDMQALDYRAVFEFYSR